MSGLVLAFSTVPCRPPPPTIPQMQFELCNGFANQRLALLSGLVLALDLNRVMVLPRVLLNGTQPTSEEVNEDNSAAVPFGWVACCCVCWCLLGWGGLAGGSHQHSLPAVVALGTVRNLAAVAPLGALAANRNSFAVAPLGSGSAA